MPSSQSLENLLSWLRTFNVASSAKDVQDLADGQIVASVLHTISPTYFSSEWLNRIHSDTALNWRLKANNLKKISEGISDFLTEYTGQQILPEYRPDVVAIAERNDAGELCSLLRLVLGCAVNCERKEAYIQEIMCMEQTVQHALMEAIQQVEEQPRSFASLLQEKELFAQQCHELQLKSSMLTEEKATLQAENDRLLRLLSPSGKFKFVGEVESARQSTDSQRLESDALVLTMSADQTGVLGVESLAISEVGGDVGGATGDDTLGPAAANIRLRQLQHQLSSLREELYRAETAKDEMKLKLDEALSMNAELKQKCDKLSKLADDAAHLKDELDIAREEATAATRLSSTVEQLRRRAEEAVELRTRCAKLEADNMVCVQRVIQLEQESRLGGNLRSQAESQRRQASQAHSAAEAALRRAELAETEAARVREELSSVNQEKFRIMGEFRRLRACCEELQSSVQASGTSLSPDVDTEGGDGHRISTAVHSRILDLEEELSRLKVSPSNHELIGSSSEPEGDIAQIPRIEDESTELETTAIKVTTNDTLTDDPQVLHSALAIKDSTMQKMEQRYRGYLWKAREVIRLLEAQRRQAVDNAVLPADVDPTVGGEVGRLRALLVEKERIIERLEQHHEQTSRQRDAEERLVVSAWYNLGRRVTREATERHMQHDLTVDASVAPPTPDVSFLARQRELHLQTPYSATAMVTASK